MVAQFIYGLHVHSLGNATELNNSLNYTINLLHNRLIQFYCEVFGIDWNPSERLSSKYYEFSADPLFICNCNVMALIYPAMQLLVGHHITNNVTNCSTYDCLVMWDNLSWCNKKTLQVIISSRWFQNWFLTFHLYFMWNKSLIQQSQNEYVSTKYFDVVSKTGASTKEISHFTRMEN